MKLRINANAESELKIIDSAEAIRIENGLVVEEITIHFYEDIDALKNFFMNTPVVSIQIYSDTDLLLLTTNKYNEIQIINSMLSEKESSVYAIIRKI